MFLSAQLKPAEQRWMVTEREAYRALWCLEETTWLLRGSPHEIMMYTDHMVGFVLLYLYYKMLVQSLL